MEDILESEIKTPVETLVPKAYPLVEEMTFRGIIQSQEQGMKLLTSIQILVNELGTEQIITIMDKMISKPQLMQKAKQYLPYIMML